MSINETQYKIDIEALQNALKIIRSAPDARLEIEPDRVVLSVLGEHVWVVRGSQAVAKVLARTVDRYYEKFDDEPVEPDLDGIEQIVRKIRSAHLNATDRISPGDEGWGEIPFAYRDAIGRIFPGNKGWSGEFTFRKLQIKLRDQFDRPVTVESELIDAVDSLCDPSF